MFSDDSDLHKCFLGSRTRARTVLVLAKYGEMHISMLAVACRTNVRMVLGAIQGGEPWFSTPLSLESLGIVHRTVRNGSPSFRLSALGFRVVPLAEAACRDELV